MAAECDKVFRRRDGLFHSGFELRSHRGGGAMAFRSRYDLFDSVGVTSDENNRLLE